MGEGNGSLNSMQSNSTTPAVDQRGVAQVDVAVAFADEALRLELLEHRQQAFEAAFRPGFEGIQLFRSALVQRRGTCSKFCRTGAADLGGAQRVLQRHLRSVLGGSARPARPFVNMLVGQFAAALIAASRVVLAGTGASSAGIRLPRRRRRSGASSLPVIGRTSR